VSTNGDYILIMWARKQVQPNAGSLSLDLLILHEVICPRMTAVFLLVKKRGILTCIQTNAEFVQEGKAHVKRAIRAAGPSNFGDDMCIVTHQLLDIFMKKRSLIWPPRAALSYFQRLN